LFGINRMAEGVASGRRSSMGLGIGYGEQKAFQNAFGRFVDMHRPKIDRSDGCSSKNFVSIFPQTVMDCSEDASRQHHVETCFADIPGDQLVRPGHQHGMEAVEGGTDGLRTHNRCRAAVAEQKERQNLLEVGRVLQVQGAKLEVSTRANASDRTMWRASLSALIAA
jgi:hypothetical protein